MTLGSVVVCKMRSLAVTQYGKSAFHIKHKGMKAMEKKKSHVVALAHDNKRKMAHD